MHKRKLKNVLMALIITLVIAGIPTVWAQDPTIPTRTPTPDPNQPEPEPSATPDDSGAPPPPEATQPTDPDPDPGPGASPTSTTNPPGSGPGLPTATSTGAPGAGPGGASTAVPGSGTTGSGQQPGIRAGVCDETPYVKAIEVVTIYAGPGDDYPEVAELGAEDMRPIIGRGYYAQWWQIQFDRETVGWVADAEVDEYGNTALVPLVVAPPINGNIPTPGAIWNPTPLPLLTCVPTPTPTPSPTATAIGTSTTGSGGTGSGGTGNGGAGSVSGQTQNEPQPTPTVGIVSAEVEGNAPAAEEEAVSSGSGISSRNAEASRAASPTSPINLILPLAGLALISGGIVLALVSRKQGGAKKDANDAN